MLEQSRSPGLSSELHNKSLKLPCSFPYLFDSLLGTGWADYSNLQLPQRNLYLQMSILRLAVQLIIMKQMSLVRGSCVNLLPC